MNEKNQQNLINKVNLQQKEKHKEEKKYTINNKKKNMF